MQRRSLLLMTPLLPLDLFVSRYLKALTPKASPAIDYQKRALRLNQLASGIQTPADARALVDFVADLFAEQLSPTSVSSSMRERVAQAEFAAVSDPRKLIPEGRVAEAWNTYAKTIDAPQGRQVTTAEINNLRDSFIATARLLWERGSRNIWAVPTIYATQTDGSIATAAEQLKAFASYGISQTCRIICPLRGSA